MKKKSSAQITPVDMTMGSKQSFARKVVVVAYYLKEDKSGALTPHFLFTVIVPKQPAKVTDDWKNARHFKLPSGFSLIKGTREMIRDGEILDIPPRYNGYFKKLISGNLAKKDIDKKIENIVTAADSALKEAKEEAGIKKSNVELMVDFGMQKIKMDGQTLRVNSFAIELKKPSFSKAIDSLELGYFTLSELKMAAKIRTRYNIPLVRPSHVRFVEAMMNDLKQLYKLEGKIIIEEAATGKKTKKKEKKKIKDCVIRFLQIIKKARKGRFIAFKYSAKETQKNIIIKSEHSREKQKQISKS